MFDFLKETVRQIVIFMICAQSIVHFRPREAYEKYLKLLLSIMILIQIFQPFCRLFLGADAKQLSERVREFQTELDNSMAEAAKQSAIAEQKLEAMSLLEVQKRLAQQGQESGQEQTARQGQESEQESGQEQTAQQGQETGKSQTAQQKENRKIEVREPIRIEVGKQNGF